MDPIEARFRDIARFFRVVTEELKQTPIVVDADDLLENPHKMLQAYCDAVGVAFDERILTWNREDAAGTLGVGWESDLNTSTGFNQFKNRPVKSTMQFPVEVDETISSSMPYYEELYAHRLRI